MATSIGGTESGTWGDHNMIGIAERDHKQPQEMEYGCPNSFMLNMQRMSQANKGLYIKTFRMRI